MKAVFIKVVSMKATMIAGYMKESVKATVIAVYMKESVKVTVIAVYMKASMTQRKNTVTGVNGLNRREIIRLRRRSGNT